jgi:hypothetical protein
LFDFSNFDFLQFFHLKSVNCPIKLPYSAMVAE